MNNPFNITKAVDYTDADIIKYWVDISEQGDGFEKLLKPTSPMPMLLLGSKGSGKTHIMRYFSYQLQKLRHNENREKLLQVDKYIGIYFRCSGLNSDRFKGKGQNEEAWNSVFSYYLELWMGQLLLSVLIDLNISAADQAAICSEVMGLFENDIDEQIVDFDQMSLLFKKLQNRVDYQVNNSAITRNLEGLEILLSPGKIIFGFPQIVAKKVSALKDTAFLYLIDELENISETQQVIINTLYRERQFPTSFRLGARLYGIKTYRTLGGDEHNREDSEFEKIILDDFLRENDDYETFVKNICKNRLNIEGYNISSINDIQHYFEEFDLNEFLSKIQSKKDRLSKSHIARLEASLIQARVSEENIRNIIDKLRFEQDLLVEKAKFMLFYRDWNDGKKILEVPELIHEEASKYYFENVRNSSNGIYKILSYFKGDLIDQLARECGEKVPYVGFNKFIVMSCGIPRNLLNILKHSFRWSHFNDKIIPFRDGKISQQSQLKGVAETSDWFFEDNRIPGPDAKLAYLSMERIGTFLRELRYSNIPPECSINVFSVETAKQTEISLQTLNFLEQYSFLVKVDSRRDKNSNDKYLTFQINGVIVPKWELAISKRGRVKLTQSEANAIFGVSEKSFDEILKDRTIKYNAPFYGHSTLQLF